MPQSMLPRDTMPAAPPDFDDTTESGVFAQLTDPAVVKLYPSAQQPISAISADKTYDDFDDLRFAFTLDAEDLDEL